MLQFVSLGSSLANMLNSGKDTLTEMYYGGRVDDHSVSHSTSLMKLQSKQNTSVTAYNRRRKTANKCTVSYITESFRSFMLSACSSPIGCRICLPLFQPRKFPLHTIYLNAAQKERLQEYREKSKVIFDKHDESHTSQLYSFACSIFQDELPYDQLYKSKKWTSIGFQNTDPSTDFRSAGLFALQNLFYLVSIEPRIIKRISQMERVSAEYYLPFAVCCINLTFTLSQLVYLHANDKTLLSEDEQVVYLGFCNMLDKEQFVFEEIFKAAFQLFDEMWIESRAKYFQFPEILLRVKERIAAALMKRPDTLSEFHRYLSIDEDDDIIKLV